MRVEVMLAGLGLVVLLSAVIAARRARRRRDSVDRFSRATSALREIAEHPADLDATHTETTPSVHVLEEVAVLRLDRTRPPARSKSSGRRARRPDAEALARRPTIASLPAISAPPVVPPADAGDPGQRAG